MKKLLCLMGSAMLIMNVYGQRNHKFFMVGERMPDLPLSGIINYKDNTAKLTNFGEKLIIIDFWNIHCSMCIELWPKLDSIQRILKDKVQFILVTIDPKSKVIPFLNKWNNTHHKQLSIPIICGPNKISKLFPHFGIPNSVWITPTSKYLLQTTGESLIDYELIKSISSHYINHLNKMKKDLSKSAYEFKQPSKELIKMLDSAEASE